jgi:hypothetical protein
MPVLKMNSIIVASLLLVPLMFFSAKLHAIAKCQDAQGKWHYGDTAHEACGDSTITIIDKTGRKVNEVLPPMTQQEREALEEELERLEEEEKQEQQREQEKRRILAIYPTEESIKRARNEKLAGQDKNIKLQERLIDNMRQEVKSLKKRQTPSNKKEAANLKALIESKQANVDEYYRSISRLRREREETALKYDGILQEFNNLTSGDGDPVAKQQERDRKLERNRRMMQIREQLGLTEDDPRKKRK